MINLAASARGHNRHEANRQHSKSNVRKIMFKETVGVIDKVETRQPHFPCGA